MREGSFYVFFFFLVFFVARRDFLTFFLVVILDFLTLVPYLLGGCSVCDLLADVWTRAGKSVGGHGELINTIRVLL